MKKLYLLLLLSFSLILAGCTQNVKRVSVMEIVNKDLIESIKEESKEIIQDYNEIQLTETGFNEDTKDLEVKFVVTSEVKKENLEKLNEIIIKKLVDKIDNMSSYITFSWKCLESEKTIFYKYSIDGDKKITLEENYSEEKINREN